VSAKKTKINCQKRAWARSTGPSLIPPKKYDAYPHRLPEKQSQIRIPDSGLKYVASKKTFCAYYSKCQSTIRYNY
jgi:hypothetical protein